MEYKLNEIGVSVCCFTQDCCMHLASDTLFPLIDNGSSDSQPVILALKGFDFLGNL